MPDYDGALTQATDQLIALYRGIERRALDLPSISVMPLLICFWALLRLYFFLFIGIFLIIPTNLVILVRNLFPGEHWRYRPFFLTHLYYVWEWLWRGEAPTAPIILISPLLNLFTNVHFERRLRRLRHEIILRDELSDATRSTLLGRLDGALERWKTPRFATLFFTALVPLITSAPTWLIDLLRWIGGRIPADLIENFVTQYTSPYVRTLIIWLTIGYLVTVPITAFLAKRGLFLGNDSERICFPGEAKGSGIYFKEREILAAVGIHAHEAPLDLWILGIMWVINLIWEISTWDVQAEFIRSHGMTDSGMLISSFGGAIFFIGMFVIAAVRRRASGRT